MSLTEETIVKVALHARPRLCAGVWMTLRDAHTAEDLFQTALLRAIQPVEAFEDEGHLLAWLRVTMGRLAIDFMRRKGREWQPLDEEVLALLDAEWSARHGLDQPARVNALLDCVEALPEKSRRLLDLRYHEGRSGDEIGGLLGTNAAAIYARLLRLHRALRECVEGKLSHEPGTA